MPDACLWLGPSWPGADPEFLERSHKLTSIKWVYSSRQVLYTPCLESVMGNLAVNDKLFSK